MAIPLEYRRLAKRLGITQAPGQSDEDFMLQVDNFRGHSKLLRQASSLGVKIQTGMTSAELRQAIHTREQELLTERGFVPEATIRLGERIVTIQRITVDDRKLRITVHYWIERPWEKDNNRGRATHQPAKEVLKKGRLIP